MLDRNDLPAVRPARLKPPARLLILGGAGFIGANLCERMVREGHYVTCLDNLATGSLANINHLMPTGRFSLIEHDITSPVTFPQSFDQIYNLACVASPAAYQMNPIQTVKTNVLGAINVLEMGRAKSAVVLQGSTSEVYGDPVHHPQHESDWGNVNPIGPRACYDEGKRCAETLFFDYHRVHGVRIRVARIFNTYGPRMAFNDGRVVSNFIGAALQGKPITIYGTGDQTRSFCYVDDLVEGLVRLAQAPDDVIGPINLGNPEELTVRDLAELVLKLTNSRSKIVHLPLPVDDPRRRRPDIGRATELLEWRPSISITAGIERTIAYFNAILRTSPLQ